MHLSTPSTETGPLGRMVNAPHAVAGIRIPGRILGEALAQIRGALMVYFHDRPWEETARCEAVTRHCDLGGPSYAASSI
jgi:hypothetical protein